MNQATVMEEEMSFEVKWSDLINRGLNIKASNLHPLIDKLLREVCNDEVKKKYPRVRFPEWHFTLIKWEATLEKYRITIAPGKPTIKG